MLKLVITDDEGRTTVVPLDRPEVTIGRDESNTIRLIERNVSRKHAVLRRNVRGYEIEDLKSYNGTKVGGTKITAARPLRDGERITIGDYQVALQSARAPVRVAREGTKTTQIAADAETALFALPPEERTATTEVLGTRAAVGKPRFVVEAGPGRGKQFVLDRDELTIGQAPECEVRLDHSSVSRQHAKIVNVGGVRILDLQSTNGVRVNGREVPYAELEPWDLVELGEVKLRFVVPGAPTARPGTAAATPARKTSWLLGGVAMGFVGVAIILFVAWPAPTIPVGPTSPGAAASPSAVAGSPDASGQATAFIAVARANLEKGAIVEAHEAATKAREILEKAHSPTGVPDQILEELVKERSARAQLDRAREQMAASPAGALATLDAIPRDTHTASDPAVARTAAEALDHMLVEIRSLARDSSKRAEARTRVAQLLAHARLAAPTLTSELERVRRDARELQESLTERTVAVAPPHPGGGGGPRPPHPGGGGREPPDEPDPPRPANDAAETAAYNAIRAAASNPERYHSLACAFLRNYPTSRRISTVRQICH